jgi:hypothetical protein
VVFDGKLLFAQPASPTGSATRTKAILQRQSLGSINVKGRADSLSALRLRNQLTASSSTRAVDSPPVLQGTGNLVTLRHNPKEAFLVGSLAVPGNGGNLASALPPSMHPPIRH